MTINIEEFRLWFENQKPEALVTWIREGVGVWYRDEASRRSAFAPIVLERDMPLTAQVCEAVRLAGGACPSRFSAAVEQLLSRWTPYEGAESFGEYALMAGKMSCPGLAAFLANLDPSATTFRAAGVHRRRAILTNCAEAVESHIQFSLPDLVAKQDESGRKDGRLFEEIRRLRRDFYKTDAPNEELEWLPKEGVRLIDKLATTAPTRIFDAFTAFKEDFEAYFRQAPMTSYRVLQRILRKTNAAEIAQALDASTSDDDWMLQYLFGVPTDPTMGEGEALDWPRLLAADWVSQNGDIELRYDEGVYMRLPRASLYDEFDRELGHAKGRARKGLAGPFAGERLHIFGNLIGNLPVPPDDNVFREFDERREAKKHQRNAFKD